MKKMLAEPVPSGTYLKPDKVKVGDCLKIEKMDLEAARTVDTDHGPVAIPEKMVVTGAFIPKGQTSLGEEVKAAVSKGVERKLYELWGASWVGKTMMVSGVITKNIKGRSTTWIDWSGLP